MEQAKNRKEEIEALKKLAKKHGDIFSVVVLSSSKTRFGFQVGFEVLDMVNEIDRDKAVQACSAFNYNDFNSEVLTLIAAAVVNSYIEIKAGEFYSLEIEGGEAPETAAVVSCSKITEEEWTRLITPGEGQNSTIDARIKAAKHTVH